MQVLPKKLLEKKQRHDAARLARGGWRAGGTNGDHRETSRTDEAFHTLRQGACPSPNPMQVVSGMVIESRGGDGDASVLLVFRTPGLRVPLSLRLLVSPSPLPYNVPHGAQGIRVGIIGAGWPGIRHAEGYKAAGGFQLAAVSDLIPARRHNLMNQAGVSREYADAADLLKDVQVDAVSVCLPNSMHLLDRAGGAGAGKHVIW